ncbi:nucleoside deaminase [Paenibacillus sp. NPDC056579]|uniref:nucleoside deaminase n=1 Tax=unclassified Paenibacillus TaxID=185978 RepID=UPI0023BAE1E7|nr:nucleoside deaminase [Paenibacillus sp. H1-7]ULL16051.1 nucleoside deaminase [Paenibacillus sp. H1-7]
MRDDRKYLLEAFMEAEKSKVEGTYPIGAVIVDSDGIIVSRGRNRVFSESDTTAHAEVDAIRNAGPAMLDIDNLKFLKKGFTLYTTCEPCPMCTCTILLSFSIARVVWAANDPEMGAMRKFKAGPHFQERFDKISYEAAPYRDLELRQREMLSDWYGQRGYSNSHWQNSSN